MQYIPLTVHLNALAQLYQQCANLSDKYDKLRKGMDDEVITDDSGKTKGFQEKNQIIIDQGPEVIQNKAQIAISDKASMATILKTTPIEIDMNEVPDIEVPISSSISKQTKKIKKSKKSTNSDSLQAVKCPTCGKLLKHQQSLKKHVQRVHNQKGPKKVIKKAQKHCEEIMVQI